MEEFIVMRKLNRSTQKGCAKHTQPNASSNKTSPRSIMEPQNITTRLETQHHIFPHILQKVSRCDFLALKEVLN